MIDLNLGRKKKGECDDELAEYEQGVPDRGRFDDDPIDGGVRDARRLDRRQ